MYAILFCRQKLHFWDDTFYICGWKRVKKWKKPFETWHPCQPIIVIFSIWFFNSDLLAIYTWYQSIRNHRWVKKVGMSGILPIFLFGRFVNITCNVRHCLQIKHSWNADDLSFKHPSWSNSSDMGWMFSTMRSSEFLIKNSYILRHVMIQSIKDIIICVKIQAWRRHCGCCGFGCNTLLHLAKIFDNSVMTSKQGQVNATRPTVVSN